MSDAHLSDEQLSSHLDGARTAAATSGGPWLDGDGPSVEGHLRVCDECRDRLAGLQEVREVLRRPPPPVAPETRAAAVASVLDAAGRTTLEVGQAGEPTGENASREGSAVTPIRFPRRPGVRVLAGTAAALAVAAAVTVPLVTSSTSGTSSSTAASPAAGAHRRAPLGTGSSSLALTPARDLGAISSASQLHAAVVGLVNGALGAQGAAGGVTQTTKAGSGSNDQPSSSAAAPLPSPASATAVPGTDTVAACLPAAAGAADKVGIPGGRTSLELTATATYQGTPAVVFVFGAPSGSNQAAGARSVAVVTAASFCRVLLSTSL